MKLSERITNALDIALSPLSRKASDPRADWQAGAAAIEEALVNLSGEAGAAVKSKIATLAVNDRIKTVTMALCEAVSGRTGKTIQPPKEWASISNSLAEALSALGDSQSAVAILTQRASRPGQFAALAKSLATATKASASTAPAKAISATPPGSPCRICGEFNCKCGLRSTATAPAAVSRPATPAIAPMSAVDPFNFNPVRAAIAAEAAAIASEAPELAREQAASKVKQEMAKLPAVFASAIRRFGVESVARFAQPFAREDVLIRELNNVLASNGPLPEPPAVASPFASQVATRDAKIEALRAEMRMLGSKPEDAKMRGRICAEIKNLLAN